MKTIELSLAFAEDIKLFEAKFEDILQSNITLIDSIAKYVITHKGKNLRPLLVILSSRLCNGVLPLNEKTYISAAIVELLHVATLIHDDVLDDADLRRGFPSIKAKWQNKLAILMGDYLLSKSLIGGAMTNDIRIIHSMATASKRLTKGEIFQLQKTRKLDITEAEYFQLISDKTAALISACTRIGALSTEADDEMIERLDKFGEYLGLAFQIKDDLLDYESKSFIIGKPAASDIKEKKLTLPIIHALTKVNDSEKKKIIALIKSSIKNKDIRFILDFVRSHDGLSYSDAKAREFAEKAKLEIALFKENSFYQTAINFVDYVVQRKK